MDEPAAGVFQVEKPVWKRNCLHTTWRSPPRLPIVYKRCLQMVSSNLDRCVAVQLSFSSWRVSLNGYFSRSGRSLGVRVAGFFDGQATPAIAKRSPGTRVLRVPFLLRFLQFVPKNHCQKSPARSKISAL